MDYAFSPWFIGEGASLLQTSLMGEIRDPSFTSSFQAVLFPVLGLEWERGLKSQHHFSSPSSGGWRGLRVTSTLGKDKPEDWKALVQGAGLESP